MLELQLLFYLFFGAVVLKLWSAIKSKAVAFGSYVGGGGGMPPPAEPDYRAQAKADMMVQRQQQRMDEQRRIEEEQRRLVEEEKARAAFQQRLGAAGVQAESYGKSRLGQLGIEDNYGILDSYMSELARVKSSIPDLDPNPGNYFTPTLFDTALSGARSQERNKLQSTFDTFAAPNFETSRFADTMDDPIIDSILDEQFADTQEQIGRAKDRGQLDETAFEAALAKMTQDRGSAEARANDLGIGVLQRYRDSLRGIADEGRARITNWDFGQTLSPYEYQSKINTMASQFGGRLPGDIRSAIGDQLFFDPMKYINAGGREVGQMNPSNTNNPNPLLNALTEDELKKKTNTVQGVF